MLLWLATACLNRPCDRVPFYEDLDGDGFGSEVSERRCEGASHWVEVSGDCDDGDLRVNPDRAEYCDGVDEDCDGQVDEEALDMRWSYHDQDQDGYGDPDEGVLRCEVPNNHVADNSDCDDGDPKRNPDRLEWCDGIDEDCDGQVDEEAEDRVERYADGDGDGYGDEALGLGCLAEGEATQPGDCDDEDAATFPGSAELESETACLTDADGDGFGPSDPDDSDPTLHPETCEDGSDDDRDGLVDCEDADCLDAEVCQERCFGGDDEDLDGLTDCEDDDCWGDDECATVWVDQGSLTWRTRSWSSSGAQFYVGQVSLSSVSGSATWGSGQQTCRWSVASASMSFSFTSGVGVGSDLIGRQGFSAAGCQLTQQGLPDFFTALPQGGPWQISASGVDWYVGQLSASSTSGGFDVYRLELQTGEAY